MHEKYVVCLSVLVFIITYLFVLTLTQLTRKLQETWCPKCFKCKETITKQVLTIEDKSYHPECLTCDICNLPLKGDFYITGEKRVCRKDAEVTNANKIAD